MESDRRTIKMPTVYMLCGVPYSGKSTWTNSKLIGNPSYVLSTDDTIETICRVCDTTYAAAFDKLMDYAEMVLELDLKGAIDRNQDIIWDQTNLTKKSRAKKLAKIPASYKKVAVNFSVPDEDEMKRRIEKRKNKIIPQNAMERMVSQYKPASLEEGFDEVVLIKNDTAKSKKAKTDLGLSTVYWC
jgi:predicted kinase